MDTRTTASKQHFSGDWTIAGVVTQVDLLSKSLQKLASSPKKCIQIDCGKISAIDMSGLQLINVWMELVKMRGVKAEMVNLPDSIMQTIRLWGGGQCFTDSYPDAA